MREGVRHTKIVATIGPVTGDEVHLGMLLDAGVNVRAKGIEQVVSAWARVHAADIVRRRAV